LKPNRIKPKEQRGNPGNKTSAFRAQRSRNKDSGAERGALASTRPLLHQQRTRGTLPSCSQVNPHQGIPATLLQ